jgi:hypothetical protein
VTVAMDAVVLFAVAVAATVVVHGASIMVDVLVRLSKPSSDPLAIARALPVMGLGLLGWGARFRKTRGLRLNETAFRDTPLSSNSL